MRQGLIVQRLVLLALVLSLIAPPADDRIASAQTPAGSDRILVENGDTAAIAALRNAGGRLLVEYDSFSLWSVGASLQSLVPGSGRLLADQDRLLLRTGALTTTGPQATAPSRVGSVPTGEQLWFVQFIGPIKSEWLADLEAVGLTIVQYLPENGYLVWGEDDAISRLEGLAATSPVIQWTGPHLPAYRIDPIVTRQLAAGKPTDPVEVTVQLFQSKRRDQAINAIIALSRDVIVGPWDVDPYTNLTVRLMAAQLIALAAIPEVVYLEPWVAPIRYDEVQNQIVAGNVISAAGAVGPTGPNYLAWLTSKGFPTTASSYPVVAVVDDGVDNGTTAVADRHFRDLGNPVGASRMISTVNCTTDPTANGLAGHGHLNAGIVGGYDNQTGAPFEDASGYQRGLGVAPYTRLANTKIFINAGTFDLTNCGNTPAGMVIQTHQAGATFTSQSWGANVYGAYTTFAQAFDSLTRDARSDLAGNQQMLHIFSNGNAGPTRGSVGSPATAKNVLSVGATENVRDNGIADGCGLTDSNNADDIATYSSRGPTLDGRNKPDLQAPGSHIQGPASTDPGYNGTGVCAAGQASTAARQPEDFYPSGQITYTWSTGTSHSTPAVAGAAALAYEYYGRVLNPGQTPSPAMLKAILTNGSRYLTGVSANDPLPSVHQGWGDVDLGLTLTDTGRILVDQSVLFTGTGQTYTVTGIISNSAQPFRVTLAWSDALGPTAGNAYVNNLDLEVTVGGNVYRGNVFGSRSSVQGGGFDQRNNLESVFLPAGLSGPFTVRVIARNIAGNGVFNNAFGLDQDFALVVLNGTQAVNAGPIIATSALVTDDTLGNGNGVLDPAEVVGLRMPLTNIGAGNATAVTSTIAIVSGPATVNLATTSYGAIATGATVTNSVPYWISVSPIANCGAQIVLRQVITATGATTSVISQVHTLRLGTLVNDPVKAVTFATPTVIPTVGTITATIPVTGTPGQVVADLDVTLNITHTFDQDLIISVRSPLGTPSVLFSRRGTSGDNLINTILNDEVLTHISLGAAPFSGIFRPEEPLNIVDGEPITGTWAIVVRDVGAGGTGTLNIATLTFTPAHPACTAATVAVPTITAIAPVTQTAASPGFTLTVTGTRYGSGLSTLFWNGGALTTTVLSSSVLQAVVPAGNLAVVGTASITVANAGVLTPSNTALFTITKTAQTITFPQPANHPVTDPPFAVTATATSGLAVAIATNSPTICTVSGFTVTLVAVGTCSLTASQPGNATYLPATPVTQTFAVSTVSQTITFPQPPDAAFADPPFAITATASSGLVVSVASNSPAVCSMAAFAVTILGAGDCVLVASQAGNGTYEPAPSVTRTVIITKAAQTITFPQPADQTFGDAPFLVTATASSGLVVNLTSNSPTICSLTGLTVTILGAGICSLTASQAGNANYQPATALTRTLTISQASQTITFLQPADAVFGDPPFAVTATASSGLAVSVSSNSPGVCTVAGFTVTIGGAGSCSLSASQAGNSNYLAATAVTRTLTISPAAQTLTFPQPADRTYGEAPFLVTATASSGLVVGLTSNSPTICAISGFTVTLLGAGMCSLTATQTGATNFQAAMPVTRTFTIAQAAQSISFPQPLDKGLNDPPFLVTATATSGLTVTLTTNSPSVCSVTEFTVTLLGAGTCSLTGGQGGDANYLPALPVTRTFEVGKLSQSIAFPQPSDRTLGDPPFLVTATASSGLVVSLSSNSPAICSVSSFTVTLLAVGTCSLTANQPGDGTWLPAPPVTRTLTVAAVATSTPTSTPTATPTATPSSTPTGTPTTAPSQTPIPTSTPPPAVPGPSQSPIPSASPSSTPSPTATPKPEGGKVVFLPIPGFVGGR